MTSFVAQVRANENMFKGKDGQNFFRTLLELIKYLAEKVAVHLEVISSLEEERQSLAEQITNLQNLVNEMSREMETVKSNQKPMAWIK